MKSKLFVCVIAILTSLSSVFAQYDRSYIKDNIRRWGECKNVAITKRNGDVALYGSNGWAGQSCPQNLLDAFKEINSQNSEIVDVQLTENGNWLVLYGSNGYKSVGAPSSLISKLKEFNNNRETITAVSFNDAGQWLVVTTEHISCSHTWIQEWLVEGMDDFGQVWAVCITDDAMVAVYQDGFKFHGNVPDDLREKLDKETMNVYRIKISGDSWFYSDGKGSYRYNM